MPNTMITIPVALYLPNLLGYARIVLAFVGLHYAIASLPAIFATKTNGGDADAAPLSSPGLCIWIWILSALLDLFDGPAARRLNQCSKFGVLLDIVADNILRTVTWVATAIVAALSAVEYELGSHAGGHGQLVGAATMVLVACGIICLEWVTMLCTQLKSAEDGKHWKSQNGSSGQGQEPKTANGTTTRRKEEPPALVSALFRNNFRSPLGIVSIYGLFSCGMWTYGSFISQIRNAIPFFYWWWALAILGRLLSIRVEIWLCSSYLRMVLVEKEKKRE